MFEVDQEPILSYEAKVLSSAGARPACDRRTVVADLTAYWVHTLEIAGFQSYRPSCFLLEGLLFYLEPQAVKRLLDKCCNSVAPGGRIGFDAINSATLCSPLTKSWIEMQAIEGAPWIMTLDDPKGYLRDRHFMTRLSVPGAPDGDHGRWQLSVIPAVLPDAPHLWIVTAEHASFPADSNFRETACELEAARLSIFVNWRSKAPRLAKDGNTHAQQR